MCACVCVYVHVYLRIFEHVRVITKCPSCTHNLYTCGGTCSISQIILYSSSL